MRKIFYIVWCTFDGNPLTNERFIANFKPVLCNIVVLGGARFENFAKIEIEPY